MRAKPRVAHVLVELGGVAQAVEDKVERAATVSGVSATSRSPSIAAAAAAVPVDERRGSERDDPAGRRLGVDVEVVGRAEDAPGSVKSAGGVCSRRGLPAASAERKCPRDAGPNAATVCRSASPSSASTATSGPTSKPCVSAPWCARRDGDRPRRDERRRPGIGRRAAVDRKDDGGVRDRERDELPPRGERDGRDDRPLDADAGGALPRGKDKRVAAKAKPQEAVGV